MIALFTASTSIDWVIQCTDTAECGKTDKWNLTGGTGVLEKNIESYMDTHSNIPILILTISDQAIITSY